MPTTFRPYQPDQTLLLPPSLREWLPEGHLADHVSDLVDGLDLAAFYAPYEGDGPAQVAVRAADDAEGSDLRLRDGGVLVSGDSAQAGGGCGVPGARGGELSEPPDDLRVSPAAPIGLQASVR